MSLKAARVAAMNRPVLGRFPQPHLGSAELLVVRALGATHRRGGGSSRPAAGNRACSPASSTFHSRSSKARKAATCLLAVAGGCVSPDIETAIPGAVTRRALTQDRSRPRPRTRGIVRGAAHDGRVSTLPRQPHSCATPNDPERNCRWRFRYPGPGGRSWLFDVSSSFYLAPY